MAYGTQLLRLVEMLRDEAGLSNSVAVGVDDVARLKQMLRRTQELLYADAEWPHLRTVFDRIPFQAGQRYYDFPESLNFDRLERVAVWDSGTPIKIERGIGFEEYATYDSENDERAEPTQKWDVRWRDTKEQIEVWPIPSTNNLSLQFIGIRKLRALIAHDDVCDLDDQLLVLLASAELLTKVNADLAKIKLIAADRHKKRLLANAGNNGRRYIVGQGPMLEETFRNRVTVRVSR